MQPGVPVTFEVSSADATTAQPFTIFDVNGTVVTVAADERLIVDGLGGNVASAAGEAVVFSDTDAGGTVTAGERVAALTSTEGTVEFEGDGRVCRPGVGLKVKAAAAGQVTVIGGGRIVKNGGSLNRSSWKEAERGH